MDRDFDLPEMPELPQHEHISEAAQGQLWSLLRTFTDCRQRGVETPAMLVPTDENLCAAVIRYDGEAPRRALQTWLAAGAVRRVWQPEEVVWICDVYVRVFDLKQPDVSRDDVERTLNRGLRDDVQSSEAFALSHSRRGCGGRNSVRNLTLPYGYDDEGKLFFRERARGLDWAETEGDPMCRSIASAVWDLPEEQQPPTPEDLDLTRAGIYVVRGEVLR